MKRIRFIVLICGLLPLFPQAQDGQQVTMLIKQGISLHDEEKFEDALAKYQEALKIEPDNRLAVYELCFTLVSLHKEDEALGRLEKFIKKNPVASAEIYSLLGNLYDDQKDGKKAIEAYQQGLKQFPDYPLLHFNLAVAALRLNMYEEAELASEQAIRLNALHASSHRIYAVATWSQNKNVPALMAFCNFLMIEPNTKRSEEVCQFINKLIQSKVSVKEGNNISINVSAHNDPLISSSEMMLALAVTAVFVEEKEKLSADEKMQELLKSVFVGTHELVEKPDKKSFFIQFYADYFYALSQTNNMPAFARLVTLMSGSNEAQNWLKEHPNELDELEKWIKSTPRVFE